MTKSDFLKGWTLLTTQPWGKAYRGTTPEATIQVEFYYKHVSRANPKVWVKVCEQAATGERWPSMSELKAALQNNNGFMLEDRQALEHKPQYVECPLEVREQLARIGVKA